MSRPMRTASTRPTPAQIGPPQPSHSAVADLLANEARHPHPDFDARQPFHMPARLARAVLAAEIHEVRLEVAAAPVARPGAKDLANVRFGRGMRDVEDVVFLAALVPAELAVERHRRDRLAARAIGHDPVRMLRVQAAAIADHERRNPQPGREALGPDVGKQRLHAARKLRLHLEPVAHLGREAVVDLEDVERHAVAVTELRRRGQMLEDDRFADRRIQVVPGAPACNALLTDARRKWRRLRDSARPVTQRLFDIDTRQQELAALLRCGRRARTRR